MRVALFLLASLLLTCAPASDPTVKYFWDRECNALQKEVSKGSKYFKNEQTGLCFVYKWHGRRTTGGPTLNCLPCELVESRLSRFSLHMIYIKDPEINLCYAYSWVGDVDGGAALATVPCEVVEKLLPENRFKPKICW